MREEIIGKVGPYYDVRIQNKSLSNRRTTLFCMKINVSMVFNSIILLCEHLNAATTTTTFLQLLHMIIHTTCRHNTICNIYKYTNTCNILYYVYVYTKLLKREYSFVWMMSPLEICVLKEHFLVFCLSQLAAYSFYNTRV